MSKTQHFLFGVATLLTMMAPPLTVPCLIAWAVMAWLGRTVDEANVSTAGGCVRMMGLILFVGAGVLVMVIVMGAMLEGRL